MSAHPVAEWVKKAEDNYASALALLRQSKHPVPDVHLIHRYLAPLNPYGVDVRYPGLGATTKEAREAVNAAKEVRRFMRLKLGLRP